MKDWKLTWGYVPLTYHTELGKLSDTTQHVTISNNLGGNKIKLKFTNRENDCPLDMAKVVVRTRNRFTGLLSEEIVITKDGQQRIVLQAEEEFWSDEIDADIKSIDDLEVDTYFKEENIVKTGCVTWCTDIWNSHLYRGDGVNGEELSYQEVLPFLGADVYPSRACFGFCKIAINTDADVQMVGVFGDSVTHMSYYSAPLTKMLYQRRPGKISVINAGICGNRLTADAPFVAEMPGHGKMFGEAGVTRIDRDLLEEYVPDVVFCLEGVNDCTHSFAFQEEKKATGEELWQGLEKIIEKVHNKGSRIIVSTVMPFGCYKESFREPAEAIRQDVNRRIREGSSADMVIDLDAFMRKEDDMHFMQDGMHFGDGVHPNAAGGKKIAEKLLLAILDEEMDFKKEEVLAVPLFENPVDYPTDVLTEMIRISFREKECTDVIQRAALRKKFVELRDNLEKNYVSKTPIPLWPEGKRPDLTEYTDNFDCRHLHNPDFVPNLVEVLLPESTTPKGALFTIAGGEHGMNDVSECYQICRDFNEWGYQCFIINGRPNLGPWSGKECGADVARAIRYVRANAKKYRIDENRIVVAGFSNGGIATEQCIQYFSGSRKMEDIFEDYEPDELDRFSADINAQICVYGPRHKGSAFDYTDVNYPPTFYAIGRKDFVAIDNVNAVSMELMERGIPVELHTFSGHPHGYAGWKIIDGQGNPNFDLWESLAAHFLDDLFKQEIM